MAPLLHRDAEPQVRWRRVHEKWSRTRSGRFLAGHDYPPLLQWPAAADARRRRGLDQAQVTLDFDEPSEDPLGHLKRIAPLLPERLQFAHDLVEPSVEMPPQFGDLVGDRRSSRGRPGTPSAHCGAVRSDWRSCRPILGACRDRCRGRVRDRPSAPIQRAAATGRKGAYVVAHCKSFPL